MCVKVCAHVRVYCDHTRYVSERSIIAQTRREYTVWYSHTRHYTLCTLIYTCVPQTSPGAFACTGRRSGKNVLITQICRNERSVC